MELPPPGQEPTAEWFAAFQAQPLAERLRLGVLVAERLHQEVKQAFPGGAAPVFPGDSVPARLAQGDTVAAELLTIAMELAPEATLDQLDQSLARDETSAAQAASLLQRLTDKGPQK